MPDRVRKALFVPCLRRYNLVWGSPLVSFLAMVFRTCVCLNIVGSTGEVSFACVLIWYSTSEGVWYNIRNLVQR